VNGGQGEREVTRIPEGVGWTALLTAYSRAQESREAAKLFDDPLASMFLAAVTDARVSNGGKLPRLGPTVDDGSSALWNAFRFYFCERTPFYDQHVLRAVADGYRQVVLVAAGLDSRAFRHGLPGNATVFELDQAAVLDFKQAVLDQHDALPTCKRVPVPVDLLAGWAPALLAAGFDGTRPAIWVAEGLLMYVSSSEAEQLSRRSRRAGQCPAGLAVRRHAGPNATGLNRGRIRAPRRPARHARYQDPIDHRVTTIDPGGCAPARRHHSVNIPGH
jgi:methyltransferase (TIGR00027 family)